MSAEHTIAIAITGIHEELAKHEVGSEAVSSPDQLRRFAQELEGMLEDLRQGRFNASRCGVARVVADSWPLSDALGNRICAAAQAYQRAAR